MNLLRVKRQIIAILGTLSAPLQPWGGVARKDAQAAARRLLNSKKGKKDHVFRVYITVLCSLTHDLAWL